MGIKNKRGIFFIMLAIVLLSLFLISATFFSGAMLRKSIQKRVETLSEFVKLTEEDLERQLFIFGFRTIYLIEEEIITTSNPISDTNSFFQEAFFNGTINNNPEELLVDATFTDLSRIMRERAKKISANITLKNPILNLSQEDPWRVKITFTTDFTARDNNNLVLWNKTLISMTYIPISGFSDPLYTLKTSGIMIINITQTPYTAFVSGSDTSNLTSHINNNLYKASTSAPSFINRLEGKFTTSSPYGIESLVNLPQLQGQGLSVEEKSVVDYIYFSTNSPDYCAVNPSIYPSWFRLDSSNLADYGVTCI